MQFYINGYRWEIITVPTYSRQLQRSDNTYALGMCDVNTKRIYINNRLCGAFFRKVLIHEVCHSAMFSYGVDMSIEQEELFCDLVSTYGDEVISIADNIFASLKDVLSV